MSIQDYILWDFILEARKKNFDLQPNVQKIFNHWIDNKDLVYLDPYPFRVSKSFLNKTFLFASILFPLCFYFYLYLDLPIIFIKISSLFLAIIIASSSFILAMHQNFPRICDGVFEIKNSEIEQMSYIIPFYITSDKNSLIQLFQNEHLTKRLFYLSKFNSNHPLYDQLKKEFLDDLTLSGIGQKPLVHQNHKIIRDLIPLGESESNPILDQYLEYMDNMSYADQLATNQHLSAYLAEYMKTHDKQSLQENLNTLFHSNKVLKINSKS